VSQCQTNCTSNLLFTPSSNMPPISVPLTLFLLPLASLLVPSTTASPLPFAKSIPEARACLTFDLPLNATNLKLGDGATCVLFSYVSHAFTARQSRRAIPQALPSSPDTLSSQAVPQPALGLGQSSPHQQHQIWQTPKSQVSSAISPKHSQPRSKQKQIRPKKRADAETSVMISVVPPPL